MITGKTNYKDVEKHAGSPAVLICSDAAKEGYNLQFCHILIHYDLPYSPAVIGQRNGRIYRKGQENNPQVFYMMMNDGYDLRLFGEIIAEKCRIIRKYSDKEIIPNIGVLPTDADDYLKKSITKFVTDYINEKVSKSTPADKNEEFKKAALSFLRKYFPAVKSLNKNNTEAEKTKRKLSFMMTRKAAETPMRTRCAVLLQSFLTRSKAKKGIGFKTVFAVSNKDKNAITYQIEMLAALDPDIKHGNLFSYLPTETHINAPLTVQIPFRLIQNREEPVLGCLDDLGHLQDLKTWSGRLFKEAFITLENDKDGSLLKQMFDKLKEEKNIDTYRYLPDLKDRFFE